MARTAQWLLCSAAALQRPRRPRACRCLPWAIFAGHQPQGIVDGLEVLGRAPQGGERGELHLEGLPHLDDLPQPVAASAQRGQDLPFRRDVNDHRAVAVPHVDDAVHLERDQRLAHRCPADAQLGSNLAERRLISRRGATRRVSLPRLPASRH